MLLKDIAIRVLEWFASSAAAAPATTPLREAYGAPIDPDEAQWRRLSSDAQRDLPLTTQERMQKVGHWLWEQNPLGNRIIELPIAYLLAEGVHLTVEDEDNQAALDRFWKDPINDMDLKLPKKLREMAIFGEQLYPAFTDEVAGTVRIGYVDPSFIATVVKDPDNTEQPIGVVLKRNTKGYAARYRVIINGPEEVFTKRTQAIRAGFADGEAFYYRVNDLSAGSRGRSDLLPLADWLDAYDQFLFGEADRAKLLRALVWDLELKNATPETVQARSKTFQLPGSGGVYVHNDSEKLDPKTPKLESADTAGGARLLRNHILGGATLPEHWFGGGGDVNRAAAAEMGAPTFKVLAMRQRVWKHILESIGRYVLLAKARADGVKPDWAKPEWSPQAVFPELEAGEVKDSAQALQQVIAGCVAAIGSGLITRKLALQLIGAVAGRIGIEIDADAELTAAQNEAARRKEEDSFTDPPGTGGGNAGAGGESDAMTEALDLVRDWNARAETRLAEVEALARSRSDDGAASAKIAEAVGAAFAERAQSMQALVDALGARFEGSSAKLTEALERQNESYARLAESLGRMRPGRKTITLPDGRQMTITEEVQP